MVSWLAFASADSASSSDVSSASRGCKAPWWYDTSAVHIDYQQHRVTSGLDVQMATGVISTHYAGLRLEELHSRAAENVS